ncbi:hypothetical protein HanRHA438_Chr12g0569811 [Helianthus annuus]|nr:hypothetical protein HanRHA438_Chr12g0569811 [Helianthus annuus]
MHFHELGFNQFVKIGEIEPVYELETSLEDVLCLEFVCIDGLEETPLFLVG